MSEMISQATDNYNSNEVYCYSPSDDNSSEDIKDYKRRGRPFKDPLKNKRVREEKREWIDDEIKVLIEAWRNEDILYNSKNKDYLVKNKRNEAISRLKDKLQEHGYYITEEQVMEKMTGLRSYYSGQKSKETLSQMNGSPDVGFRSSWRFMRSLTFLNDSIIPRKTMPTVKQRAYVQEKNENVSLMFVDDSETSPHSTSLVFEGGARDSENSDLKYADFIVDMLRKIPEGDIKDSLKYEIHGLLLNAKQRANPR